MTTWRTYTGAEYNTAEEIPCFVIANRYLVDDTGTPIGEDHPELRAEITRRGRAVYRDHGYGDQHQGIPVAGCNHQHPAVSPELLAFPW